MRTFAVYPLLLLVLVALHTPATRAQIETSLPVSAELGTSIAQEQFPVTLKLDHAALFMTDPLLSYTDSERVALAVSFQAYDHRPDAGIAISETGKARFSGKLGYEPASAKVLLHQPQVDFLEFDRKNPASSALQRKVLAHWGDYVKDPMRFDLPRHPYLIPFRQNITDLGFDGQHIIISVAY